MPSAGTASQSGDSSFNQTSTTSFQPASAEELALRQRFAGLGGQQQQTVQDIMSGLQGSAFAMNPQDLATFNSSYNAARQQLQMEGKDYADFLAGGRGLRMSDTPVSQQALQRFGLGMSALESDRARAGLELGLAGNQYRANTGLMAAQSLPAGNVAAFNPLYNERMASGTTTSSGTGRNSMSYQQPLMQTILQGTQAFNQLGQGMSSFAKGATGAGSIGGMFG